MHHNLYKRKHPYTVLAVAIALVGCNGEGEKSTDNGSPGYVEPATITAQNATFITEYQDSYLVDLSDKVSVSDGKSFALIDVTSLTDAAECQPLETMAQSFTIAAQETKACDYEYKVAVVDTSIAATSTASNTLAPASLAGAPTDIAITRVAVAGEAPEDVSEATLPAISYVTLMGEQITVTVDAELLGQAGYVVPDGFSIEPGSVITPYSEGGSIDDVGTHTITYTPRSDFEGIERILFSYISENGSDILLGTLDVAVSSKPNQGITVQDNISYDEIEINKQSIIDVSPYVSSIDEGQELQLVYVDSFNAATAPFDPENLSNTEFTFQTSKMGNHYVSFAVSDNNGAFAMGLMEVPVFDPNDTGQWDDIKHEDLNLNFTAPLTSQEAAGNQIEYRESRVDGDYTPAVDLALFDTATAQNYCGTKGRLPTSAELVSLSNYGTTTDGETIHDTYNWPISESYLATNGEGFDTVDMNNGTPSEYMAGNYLVTCVEGGLTVEAPTEDPIANGTDEAVITFTLLDEYEESMVGSTINFTVQSDSAQASLATLNEATDENGQAIARVTNIKAEEVMVCGEVGIQEACTIATFIGDPATASIVSVSGNTVGWSSEITGSKDEFYPVKTKVEDSNGNPVQDVAVELVTPAEIDEGQCQNSDCLTWRTSGTTAEDGVQLFEVQNSDPASGDVTKHSFTHINEQGASTDDEITLYWGTWQWDTPLEIYMGDTCPEEFSPMTAEQMTEYANARNDNEAPFIKDDWTTDPLMIYINSNKNIAQWFQDIETEYFRMILVGETEGKTNYHMYMFMHRDEGETLGLHDFAKDSNQVDYESGDRDSYWLTDFPTVNIYNSLENNQNFMYATSIFGELTQNQINNSPILCAREM